MATIPNFNYNARVIRVIDGDTFDVEIDIGFRMVARLPLRLAHVDAPENNTPAGKAVTAWVKKKFGELPAEVVVHTYKPQDKYGRYLADVEVKGSDLKTMLFEEEMAEPYEGGKKV